MITLHEPTFDAVDEEYVLEALRSTWVSTGGPFVDRFERELAGFVGAKYAVSTTNGTAALQLMIETLRRTRGVDGPFDVLVPTLSFIATAAAVVHAGGSPVFLDTAPGSMLVRAEDAAAFVTRHYSFSSANRTWTSNHTGRPLLAYMPVHIMGFGDAPSKLEHFASELHVPVLEDAAEALGSRTKDGRHLGTAGLASAFSFNGNKVLTTGGGGMIVTDDEAFAKRAKHLSTTAKTDAFRYVHDEVGHNFRLVNLLAALGCSQLAKLPERLARKRAIFDLYERALGEFARVRVYEEPAHESNCWLVNAVFETRALREDAIRALTAIEVATRPLWTPFHLQPALAGHAQPVEAFPNAEDIWNRALSLPSSPQLPDDDVRRIAQAILATCARRPASTA